MANKKITSRDVDFAKWYTDVVNASRLAAYSNVKGCIILEPNGYAIWEKMQEVLDGMFKETGHKNIAMPMLIPEHKVKKEKPKGGTKEIDKLIRRLEREIEKQENLIAELDAQIEVSGADYQELTRLLGEKEEAEMLLLDLMEQWETAQESVEI